MAGVETAAKICEAGGDGLIFPATTSEYKWPDGLRAILYGVGLIYFFLGVAIVADIFMGAIEMVTSRRVQTRDANGRIRTSMLWNETVATLSLMALGSSAPEIFLSVIDIIKKEFHFGALGPSTIVGSAAFNLLVIIAVCVAVIPEGEVRIIENRPAFYITAAFSLGAYLWMAFILTESSPDTVDVWEGIATAGLLPVLIWVSYKFDRGDADFILEKLGFATDTGDEEEVIEEKTTPDGPSESYVKFECERLMLGGSVESKKVELSVKRTGSTLEEASISYLCEGLSAVPGYDFEEAEGILVFEPGETVKYIELEILPKAAWRQVCKLLVVLKDPEGDIQLDPSDDGGEEASFLTITIDKVTEGTAADIWSRLDSMISLYTFSKGMQDWKEQIAGCFFLDSEEDEEPSRLDAVLHWISLPWKIIFSLLPPTAFFGGWLAFVSSLIGIAATTACISDLAELFGCVISMPDIVTAVTFVALGTSMPDLFASLTAAREDPTADASVVNVTGSNSVNVFMGLGIPWTLAALYWQMHGRDEEWEIRYPEMAAKIEGAAFVVESKNLGFSVLTFCVVCCVALLLLHWRRAWLGGELGGPFWSKVNTFVCFIVLWLGWVAIVSWRVLRYSDDWGNEPYFVQGGCVCALVVGVSAAIVHMKVSQRRMLREEMQVGIEVAPPEDNNNAP